MNQQQKEFHDRVAELLARTERLQQAVRQFAESVEVEQNDDSLVTVGAGTTMAGEAEGNTISVAPEHGDALAPDYAPEPVEEYDNQPPRERVETAFEDVQTAVDDVNELVDGIDIEDLLDGIDLDGDLQL